MLELADDGHDKPSTIDVLIGSDHYWTIVTEEVIQINKGPTATLIRDLPVYSISLPLQSRYIPPSTTSQDDLLLSTLKCVWQLESVGISNKLCMEEEQELFLMTQKLI